MPDVLNLAIKVLGVLKKVHQSGYVHGDLKLENILFEKNENGTSIMN